MVTTAHVRMAFGEGVTTEMVSSRLTMTSHREGNWMGMDGQGWYTWVEGGGSVGRCSLIASS